MPERRQTFDVEVRRSGAVGQDPATGSGLLRGIGGVTAAVATAVGGPVAATPRREDQEVHERCDHDDRDDDAQDESGATAGVRIGSAAWGVDVDLAHTRTLLLYRFNR